MSLFKLMSGTGVEWLGGSRVGDQIARFDEIRGLTSGVASDRESKWW